MGKTGKFLWGVMLCLCLAACGAAETATDYSTPENAAENTMAALKNLELNTFNEHTQDSVYTRNNWLGVPVVTEYRIFNGLQNPGLKRGKWRKKQEANRKFAEYIVKNLSWEIIEVKEAGDTADIKMEITNQDMSDVMGNYMIHLWEVMLESEGSGVKGLLQEINNIDYDQSKFLTYLEDTGERCTNTIIVTALKEDGEWKLCVSDEFISAFMGNFDTGDYSEEIEKRLEELELLYEVKMEKWGEEFGDKIVDWTDKLFD